MVAMFGIPFHARTFFDMTRRRITAGRARKQPTFRCPRQTYASLMEICMNPHNTPSENYRKPGTVNLLEESTPHGLIKILTRKSLPSTK
jgi:hypothetical protein